MAHQFRTKPIEKGVSDNFSYKIKSFISINQKMNSFVFASFKELKLKMRQDTIIHRIGFCYISESGIGVQNRDST